MRTRIGAAFLMLMLTVGASAAMNSVAASPSRTAMQKLQPGSVTDFSARRRIRPHRRYAYRPIYRPHYYDRPYYYAPAPFFPFLGLGYGPWW